MFKQLDTRFLRFPWFSSTFANTTFGFPPPPRTSSLTLSFPGLRGKHRWNHYSCSLLKSQLSADQSLQRFRDTFATNSSSNPWSQEVKEAHADRGRHQTIAFHVSSHIMSYTHIRFNIKKGTSGCPALWDVPLSNCKGCINCPTDNSFCATGLQSPIVRDGGIFPPFESAAPWRPLFE